jgi:hypothetical protein
MYVAFCFEEEGVDNVDVDALFELVKTVDQECCAHSPFKGQGTNK